MSNKKRRIETGPIETAPVPTGERSPAQATNGPTAAEVAPEAKGEVLPVMLNAKSEPLSEEVIQKVRGVPWPAGYSFVKEDAKDADQVNSDPFGVREAGRISGYPLIRTAWHPASSLTLDADLSAIAHEGYTLVSVVWSEQWVERNGANGWSRGYKSFWRRVEG